MSFSLLEEAALQYWEQLDCPRSLTCHIMARNGDWAGVLRVYADPMDYADPMEYGLAAAASNFLKKNPFISGSTDEERKSAAEESWLRGEARCYQTNERLSPYLVGDGSHTTLTEFLCQARRNLIAMVGSRCDTDPCEPNSIWAFARHGPGTVLSSAVAKPTAADKMSDPLTLTRGASGFLPGVLDSLWGKTLIESMELREKQPRDMILYTAGNRFTTVPKTALTDRGISIEASLNVYVQLGIGSLLRNRLRRRTGWDLDVAASIHRKVAQRASIDGAFATIDLSNASDTLCKNLVRILLRDTQLLSVMEDSRSTKTFFRGAWHLLEKFSSMGNGFTFELETCIFACIVKTALEFSGYPSCLLGQDFFVFGDDIIIPSSRFREVEAALEWCGFELNARKSFATGSFRESCGGDFFAGAPVRAFYFKDQLVQGSQAAFKLHNGAYRCFSDLGVNSPWFTDWVIRRFIPGRLRLGGPVRLGDSVLHGKSPLIRERYRWVVGIRWLRTVVWGEPILLNWKYWSDLTRLACRLTGQGSSLGISTRGVRLGIRLAFVTDS